jgi:hypothetical protein
VRDEEACKAVFGMQRLYLLNTGARTSIQESLCRYAELKKVAGFDDFANPGFIFLLSEVVSQSVLAPIFFLLFGVKA